MSAANPRPPQAAVSIRPATPADSAAVLRCLHIAFEPYRQNYSPEAFLDTVLTPETLIQRFATMDIFVAVDSTGEVVGTVACQVVKLHKAQLEGHIRGMAVLPHWHGRRVAELLLKHVETVLREKMCSQITLDTTEPLARAARFYEKQGYRRSGRVGNFFGMPLIEYLKTLHQA